MSYDVPKNREVTKRIVQEIMKQRTVHPKDRMTLGEWQHFVFMQIGQAFEDKDEPFSNPS